MQVNIVDAKNRLSQIIQSALSGEEVIIANRGSPVVRLVPVDQENEPAVSQTLGQWLAKNPLPQHLKGSDNSIDESIEHQRESWD